MLLRWSFFLTQFIKPFFLKQKKSHMRIGGFHKLSVVDYPGKVAAVVFTQGCNFRCGYCHNPQLVCPSLFKAPIPEQYVIDHLRKRQGKLQGVVVTGGEPTLQKDLVDFIIKIKGLGFLVKLDTNGSHPKILAMLLSMGLIDYVAMDVKTAVAKYKYCAPELIQESIQLIINSGVPHQFRTTMVKKTCSVEDVHSIRQSIAGASHYVLQPFIASKDMIDPSLALEEQYTDEQFSVLAARFDV